MRAVQQAVHQALATVRACAAPVAVAAAVLAIAPAQAAVTTYGDADVLGTGSYGSDPTAGATLQGLAPGATTFAGLITGHGFPFSPGPGEFAGTDQIYVGSVQTGVHDGYSGAAERINGPQVITLDFGSLIPTGSTLLTLTLGIAADDFQQPSLGQLFNARINGVDSPALTAVLNAIDQGGPVVQFFTIGLPLSVMRNTGMLTLEIDQGGDGGDGWAIDFLTVGVTFVPAPGATALGMMGLAAIARRRR